jgi:Flp pilus assembly protein TadG
MLNRLVPITVPARAGARHMFSERRSVAALEFAMVAPVVLTMTLAVFDLARALIAWEELQHAAEAIVEAAEKLSETTVSGQPATQLNLTAIQAAMSTIYPEMPGLAFGAGTGAFPGKYGVTLSSIVFLEANNTWCTTTSGCTAETPNTLWSAYLTEGGAQLLTSPVSSLQRQCVALTAVKTFPDNSQELADMVTPSQGATGIPLIPQLVADVQYQFQPSFPLFLGKTTFTIWASATLPAPMGGVTQEISFDPSAGTGSVLACTNIPAPPT